MDIDFNDRNVDQSFGKRINAFFLSNCAVPFLSTNVFYWGVSHLEKWTFLNLNIFIRICIVGTTNLFWSCKYKRADEQKIENCIVIDRSEAEKFEFIYEFMSFFSLLFSNLIQCVTAEITHSWRFEVLLREIQIAVKYIFAKW